MDVIVRYENNEKSVRFMSQVGAYLKDEHIPPSKTKAVSELHFTGLTKSQCDAVVKAYHGDVPDSLGVHVDVVPDFPIGGVIEETEPFIVGESPRETVVSKKKSAKEGPLSESDRKWLEKATKPQ